MIINTCGVKLEFIPRNDVYNWNTGSKNTLPGTLPLYGSFLTQLEAEGP